VPPDLEILLELRRRLLSKRLQIVTIGLLVPAGLAGCGQIMLSQPSAESLVARGGFQWQTSHTAHFDIHVESGSPAALQIETIELDAEASRRHVLEVIDADGYPSRVSIFVVGSRPHPDPRHARAAARRRDEPLGRSPAMDQRRGLRSTPWAPGTGTTFTRCAASCIGAAICPTLRT